MSAVFRQTIAATASSTSAASEAIFVSHLTLRPVIRIVRVVVPVEIALVIVVAVRADDIGAVAISEAVRAEVLVWTHHHRTSSTHASYPVRAAHSSATPFADSA